MNGVKDLWTAVLIFSLVFATNIKDRFPGMIIKSYDRLQPSLQAKTTGENGRKMTISCLLSLVYQSV